MMQRGTYQDRQLRAILEADFQDERLKEYNRPVRSGALKSVLIAMAMYRGNVITLDQLAILTGLGRQKTVYSVMALLDLGFATRVEADAKQSVMPSRGNKSIAWAYEVNWHAVLAVPRVDLRPTAAVWPKRIAEARAKKARRESQP